MAEPSESLLSDSADESPTFGKNSSFELDKPVGSASISPCGRDVVLASRQGLHIIDLDSPWSPPRHLSHHTPWEVADVQWSPFAARDYWVVSTSNQKAIVWNLAMTNTRASIEHVLHAHTRAITDINFSAHHPDILATCAVDSYVHCWDLRHSARPAMTFCDWFAGATQVKWNRQDPHILASSHDRVLRIWDDRKGAYPLRSIEAHATKIYGVDWNRTKTNIIATCSLDKTIKFWDYTGNIDEPTWMIHTPFPVWRARHTPFGSGLLAMPQRGDYDLHLYDRRQGEALNSGEETHPVHRFSGHDDQVKEFLWRPRGHITQGLDNREFQLVTWGADRVLRLHCVNEDVYQGVGYEKGKELKSKFNVTRKNAQYKTFRESTRKFEPRNPKSGLADEFQSENKLEHESRGALGMTLSGAPLKINSGWGIMTSMGSVAGGGANQRREVDAISWMRGVKIGKRETASSELHRSLSSMLSPSFKSDRIWDTFESLGEEITHVGDKFGKVIFDKIDVPNRFLIVSFPGPWGLDNSSIYIKTQISFPKDYPERSTPTFSIEKTTSMSIEVLQKISSEVQSVANAYLSRQKNCFEALLRYLLGEQDLEDSLLWLKERPDHTDLDLSQDLALSSSDEDEDVDVDEFLNNRGQRIDMGDGMLVVSNAQLNVPSPKTCGALWSGDGRLVCFFPPREDKSQSLLDLKLKGSERFSRSHKSIFEGFGRFHNKSSIPKKTASTLETIESEDSDYEDISSSSGSSSTSGIIDALSHHFIPSIAWRGDASETQRAVSIDESQRSSGDTGPPKSIGSKLANIISIHDFKGHLPSKKMLAQQFLFDGPDCYTKNAEVAASNGNQRLADVWELVDLILREEVPLDFSQHPQKDELMVFLKRCSFSNLGRKDSAVDLSADMAEDVQYSMKGSIKWGGHPFGRWLVEELFRYFEQIADTQMLAMLSCVFSESRPIKPILVPISTSCWPIAMKNQNNQSRTLNHCQADLNSYFPFEEVARSLLELEISNEHVRSDPRTGIGIPYSGNSSVDASHSDPLNPFSTSGTPPPSLRPSRTSFERVESQTTSISTSPEQHRQAHRSNSNLASAFAASFSRPFSFSASASSSPPNVYPRKRLSPVGSYLANAPAGVTWGTTSFFGKPSNMTEDPKPAYTLSLSDMEEDESVARKPVLRVKLKNQDQFHEDGYATVPLLDPSQEWRYRAYRESYAHMLYIWEIPLTRCKLLKFNCKLPATSSPSDLNLEPSLAIGKSAIDVLSNTDHLRLGFQTHCTTCFATLNPQNSSKKCTLCTSSQSPLICLFCFTLIQGLASPCLSCGHVLHLSCRSILLSLTAPTLDFPDHEQCITGCGCNCVSHAVVEVEYPSRRKSSASMTVIGDTAGEQVLLAWKDASPEEEDLWGDVAYESLAKNLGARYLTPRPSQIWRGGG